MYASVHRHVSPEVVPDGHQELRRQLLPRGGNNTNPKRLELFFRRLGGWPMGFGARDGFKARRDYEDVVLLYDAQSGV